MGEGGVEGLLVLILVFVVLGELLFLFYVLAYSFNDTNVLIVVDVVVITSTRT